MLSTDKNILKDGNSSQGRMKDYGGLVDELHIVVKSRGSRVMNQRFGNVFVCPTNDWIWPLYFFNAYRISSDILRNWKLDIKNCIVTCQDPFETGLVGYLLKIFKSVPLQIQIHADFLSPYFWQESLKNRIRVLLAKQLIKKADSIRVVSERVKNSLVASGYTLKSIEVLPIFVDTDKIKNSPIRTNLYQKYPDHDFIILMASRLTKEKNIGLAVEAMGEVVKDYPRTLLLIVGDGPECGALKSQIINHKLQTNIKLAPWTNDLSSYYKTADLFLLTSNYEGYGRTAVEAAAAGLPVLMTDVGVAIGHVIPVGSRKDLVNGLHELISNRVQRDKILEDQRGILNFYSSKEDYLNKIKQSWQNCFS